MIRLFLFCVAILQAAVSIADISKPKVKLVTKVGGVAWGFDFISPNELLVTEKSGSIFYFNLKTNKKSKLNGPKVKVTGQGGLLDIKFKVIDDISYVYITFSEKLKGSVTTSLARGEFKNNKIANLKTIFRAKVKGSGGRHFGSRLAFNGDKLFITIGDRGERKYAQDLSYHNGKLLRLNLDGSIPVDNPYVKNQKVLDEIWSYGHRNSQGLDFDPVSKKLFSVEFGPRGGDELNLISPKKNYGWPIITYGKEYYGLKIGQKKKTGMEQPVFYWVPSISPSGMGFYTGNKIKKWKNNLFIANLSSRHLRRLVLKNQKVVSEEKLFTKLDERIRHVDTSPDGYLYFSTDSGKLFKVLN